MFFYSTREYFSRHLIKLSSPSPLHTNPSNSQLVWFRKLWWESFSVSRINRTTSERLFIICHEYNKNIHDNTRRKSFVEWWTPFFQSFYEQTSLEAKLEAKWFVRVWWRSHTRQYSRELFQQRQRGQNFCFTGNSNYLLFNLWALAINFCESGMSIVVKNWWDQYVFQEFYSHRDRCTALHFEILFEAEISANILANAQIK